jgi:hypothetical protein
MYMYLHKHKKNKMQLLTFLQQHGGEEGSVVADSLVDGLMGEGVVAAELRRVCSVTGELDDGPGGDIQRPPSV